MGIIALPLAMAFGVASGVKPENGIMTAIIAGFVVALLGGSRLLVAGPAGAFIGLLYSIVDKHGIDGLFLATFFAGILLLLLGLLRLGSIIRFIPVPLIVGFTNGIAVIIALSQLRDFLGLRVASWPSGFFAQISAVGRALDQVNLWALSLGCLGILTMLLWPKINLPRTKFLTKIPAALVVILWTSAFVWMLDIPVETIGSRFGELPRHLPTPSLPTVNLDILQGLVGPILAITMLGAIESLLCARVADTMTGDHHNPNQELIAQGAANCIVPLFGGFAATGTLARTVANIKSGAVSPISSIIHALTLIVIVAIAAPLASHIPLFALASVLIIVAWNMGDWKAFAELGKHRNSYRAVLLVSFILTVVVDVTAAVQIGLLLACFFFIKRVSEVSSIELISTDELVKKTDQRWFKCQGVLFFGSVGKLDVITQSLSPDSQGVTVYLDFSRVVFLDVSFAEELRQIAAELQRSRNRLTLVSPQPQAVGVLQRIDLEHLMTTAPQTDFPLTRS